jgi:hypothetical protein
LHIHAKLLFGYKGAFKRDKMNIIGGKGTGDKEKASFVPSELFSLAMNSLFLTLTIYQEILNSKL